ncbi:MULTISPECIES: hypothetical protein [Flavobacterium]|uniref:Uncharacterized protein n=1 Tax=Flavobacterium jumunjinense TaxID=998845 RepID=A0ABV5GPT2_9FLAO|nr:MULTISPECIES: hypothetical protein [Flavobacterium]
MTKKEQLVKRNNEVHDIVIVSLKTSEELDAHRKTRETERNEYYGNYQ